MFSVIFPGQGSQVIGMGKEFFDKYPIVKDLFHKADDTLNFSLSKIILDKDKPKTSSASLNKSLTSWKLLKNSFPIPIV